MPQEERARARPPRRRLQATEPGKSVREPLKPTGPAAGRTSRAFPRGQWGADLRNARDAGLSGADGRVHDNDLGPPGGSSHLSPRLGLPSPATSGHRSRRRLNYNGTAGGKLRMALPRSFMRCRDASSEAKEAPPAVGFKQPST